MKSIKEIQLEEEVRLLREEKEKLWGFVQELAWNNPKTIYRIGPDGRLFLLSFGSHGPLSDGAILPSHESNGN